MLARTLAYQNQRPLAPCRSDRFSDSHSLGCEELTLNLQQALAERRSSSTRSLATVALCLCSALLLAGCELISQKSAEEPIVAARPEPAPAPLPSAEPLANATKADIRYAQTTLNTLGFKLGSVDGIWGPRSAQAMREFEKKYGLTTANGLLSELNLYMLEIVSNTNRLQFSQSNPKRPLGGIRAKLSPNTPLSAGAQLIILDRSYALLAKPNPYSEQLRLLAPGTGVYVISLQEGWYEVESDDKQHGFIKAD